MKRTTCFCILALALAMPLTAQNPTWTSTYFPGTTDNNGQLMGGNEIMQLVAHKRLENPHVELTIRLQCRPATLRNVF